MAGFRLSIAAVSLCSRCVVAAVICSMASETCFCRAKVSMRGFSSLTPLTPVRLTLVSAV